MSQSIWPKLLNSFAQKVIEYLDGATFKVSSTRTETISVLQLWIPEG